MFRCESCVRGERGRETGICYSCAGRLFWICIGAALALVGLVNLE